MKKKVIKITPVQISLPVLERLEEQGLVMLFRGTPDTRNPPEGKNVGKVLYKSDEKYGPHQLIAVGINMPEVRLNVHGDHEEFLLPPHGAEVKKTYLLVCHLSEEEIRVRDHAGTLAEDDFTCLSLYPAPRGAEMFTMLSGTVHCELSEPGDGEIGCFFVTESANLNMDWIDLQKSDIMIRDREIEGFHTFLQVEL